MAAPPQMSKFDPADHPGNLFEAFGEFIDSFRYEYDVIAKALPAGTDDTAACELLQPCCVIGVRYSIHAI